MTAKDAFVTSMDDPLWQEWLEVEARVWADGVHMETISVCLGKVRRGVLRRIIREFERMLDTQSREPTTPVENETPVGSPPPTGVLVTQEAF